MFDLTTWLWGLGVLLAFSSIVWVGSLALTDASIVDRFWGLFFIAAGATYAVATPTGVGPRAMLVLVLVVLWGGRLAAYITWRNWGDGEDFRYQKMRERGGDSWPMASLVRVFWLQAVIAWVVSLPLLAAVGAATDLPWVREELYWLDWVGVAVFAVGFFFEAVGDWQLTRFKADPANEGKVMDRGLWGLTRHPNYFGDFTVWWGFFLIGLAAGGWWGVIGSAVMSVFLLRISGAALLEKSLTKTKPKYADYVQEVNAFFPGPRRRG